MNIKELNKILESILDSDNFKNWFGDSKVVDKEGNPLVCIHRTNADFDTFDIERSNLNNITGKGISFVTKASDNINMRAYGNKVIECYLKIENPFDLDKVYPKDFFKDWFSDEVLDYIWNTMKATQGKDDLTGMDFLMYLRYGIGKVVELKDVMNVYKKFQEHGYDGYVSDDKTMWTCFSSKQIKSVRNTTFSDSENINEEAITYINWQNKDFECLILDEKDNSNSLRQFLKDYKTVRCIVFDKFYFFDFRVLHEIVSNRLKVPCEIENCFIINNGKIDGGHVRTFVDRLLDYSDSEIIMIAEEYRTNCERLEKFGLSLSNDDKKLLDDICNGDFVREESLNEKYEELKDGIYATTSAYDVLNQFKNKKKPLRVVYDSNNGYYFLGDALRYIHGELISVAYDNGFYYDEMKNNSRNEAMIYLGNNLETNDVLMLSFFPIGFGDIEDLDNERSSDWYTHKYVYDFGLVYVHEANDFTAFDLYNVLGTPVETEELELPESFNKINTLIKSLHEDIISLDKFKFKKNVDEFTNDLLEIGKQVNPSNPYDWVADKFYDMSKWNKKDWEYLFKKELNFKDIRDAQTTFELMSKKVREIADAYAKTNESLNEQRAFHGSPYNFEKFDLSKFNRGDYGYGVYFTHSKGYATDYGDVKEYEIPDNEYLLDWDFNTQSDTVDDALYQIWKDTKDKDTEKKIEHAIYGTYSNTGGCIYYAISEVLGLSAKGTSEFLYKYGIKGTESFSGNCIAIFNPDDIKKLDTIKSVNEELERFLEHAPMYKSNQPSFEDFYNYVIKNPKCKKCYFEITYPYKLRISSDTILHDYKKHSTTIDEWNDCLVNIENIVKADVSKKKLYSSNAEIYLLHIKGNKDYGLTLQTEKNYNQITTLFFEHPNSIDNWIITDGAGVLTSQLSASDTSKGSSVTISSHPSNDIIQYVLEKIKGA